METLKVITLVIIFCLIAFLNFKVYVSYDLASNIGTVHFKILNYKAFYVKFFIKNKCLNLVDKKLKHTSIPLFNNEDIKNYTDLNIIIFRKLDIKRIETNLKFGIRDNPFASIVVLSSYNVVAKVFFTFLKYFKERADIVISDEWFSESNMLILNFKCSVSLSIIDYLWGILESKVVNIKIGERLKWQKTT